MADIDLSTLKAQTRPFNEVDLHLIRIASQGGQPNLLETDDFIRGAKSEEVSKFLKITEDYLAVRIMRGPEDQGAVDKFFKEIGAIDLPAQYKIVQPSGLQPNPTQVSFILRGRLTGFGFYGANFASESIQDHEVSALMHQFGMGFKFMWPIDLPPAWERHFQLSSGLITTVSIADGTMKIGAEEVGDLDLFGLGASLAVDAAFPVNSWFLVNAGFAVGFEGGHYSFSPNAQGTALLGEPCTLQGANLLTEPDQATTALGCKFKTTLGAYTSWPVTAMIGVRFAQRANIDVGYQFAKIDAPDEVLAPHDYHRLMTRFGWSFY